MANTAPFADACRRDAARAGLVVATGSQLLKTSWQANTTTLKTKNQKWALEINMDSDSAGAAHGELYSGSRAQTAGSATLPLIIATVHAYCSLLVCMLAGRPHGFLLAVAPVDVTGRRRVLGPGLQLSSTMQPRNTTQRSPAGASTDTLAPHAATAKPRAG